MLLRVIDEVCEYVSLAHIVTSHVLYDWAKPDAAVSSINQRQRFIATSPPRVELCNTQMLVWRAFCRNNLSVVRQRYCCQISWESPNSYRRFFPTGSRRSVEVTAGLLVCPSGLKNSERFLPVPGAGAQGPHNDTDEVRWLSFEVLNFPEAGFGPTSCRQIHNHWSAFRRSSH